MPWCPKCKEEYEEGITRCAECDIELVETFLEADNPYVELAEGKIEMLDKFVQFLEYSGVTEHNLEKTENEGIYLISIRESDYKQAKSLFQIFEIEMQKEQEEEEIPEEEIADEEEIVTANIYADENEKVEDVKSSAFAFLTISILGLTFVTLSFFGVIELSIYGASKVLFYLVAYSLLIVFFFVGIHSVLNIRKMKAIVDKNKSQEEEVINWFIENHTSESIDEGMTDTAEEEQYFYRTKKMKAAIEEKFGNISAEHMEKYIEELYDKIFS